MIAFCAAKWKTEVALMAVLERVTVHGDSTVFCVVERMAEVAVMITLERLTVKYI